jgi:hypothetical protein
MGIAKKLALGVVSLVPAVALGVAVWAFFDDSAPEGLASAAIVLSGLTDLFLAPFFIPHVHDNRRLGDAARIVWLALIGFVYDGRADLLGDLRAAGAAGGSRAGGRGLGRRLVSGSVGARAA